MRGKPGIIFLQIPLVICETSMSDFWHKSKSHKNKGPKKEIVEIKKTIFGLF